MKKRFIGAIFLSLMLISGCGGSNGGSGGVVQIDEATVTQFEESQKNGFFLKVRDKEEPYFTTLKEVAESEGVSVNYYYVFQPNGAEGELVDTPAVDAFSSEFDVYDRLYYIQNGEDLQYVDLDGYDGMELQGQIRGFIENFAAYEK